MPPPRRRSRAARARGSGAPAAGSCDRRRRSRVSPHQLLRASSSPRTHCTRAPGASSSASTLSSSIRAHPAVEVVVVPVAAHVQPLQERVALVEHELGAAGRRRRARRCSSSGPCSSRGMPGRGQRAVDRRCCRATRTARPAAPCRNVDVEIRQAHLDPRSEELERRNREPAVELAQIEIAAALRGREARAARAPPRTSLAAAAPAARGGFRASGTAPAAASGVM